MLRSGRGRAGASPRSGRGPDGLTVARDQRIPLRERPRIADFLASVFVGGLVGTVISLLPLRFLPGWDLSDRGAAHPPHDEPWPRPAGDVARAADVNREAAAGRT
ncbi:MAG TPA: hypothetical protein DCX12_02895 [Chloroflexi bacterium]|nr:hypothetical protein [Chloroflexota bacterium]